MISVRPSSPNPNRNLRNSQCGPLSPSATNCEVMIMLRKNSCASTVETFYVDHVNVSYQSTSTQAVLVKAGYRYGFNGQEKDNEVLGEGLLYDYGFRSYDPRIGRFQSEDPLTSSYPWYTPYQFAGNSPIRNIDLDGLEEENYLLKMFKDWLFGPQRATNDDEVIEIVNKNEYIQKRVQKAQEITSTLNEGGHLILDGIGMIPLLGEPIDGLNAVWYYSEGDYVNASLSLAGMIPFFGWGATGTKFGLKVGTKTINNSGDYYRAVNKLDIGERIAEHKKVGGIIARENKWQRNTTLEKKNPWRIIYVDEKGMNYSLDTQHGRFEVINKRGKHQGEIDFSGKRTKGPDLTGQHDLNVK